MYRHPPWAICAHAGRLWVYEGIAPERRRPDAAPRGACSTPTTRAASSTTPRAAREWWRDGGLGSLTHVPQRPDLAGAPAGRPRRPATCTPAACVIDGQGFLFVGHSDAGKSTTMELRARRARRARRDPLRRPQHRAPLAAGLRRRPARLLRARHVEPRRRARRLVGRGAAARHPLPRAVRARTRSCRSTDRKAVWQRLLATLIRPLVTADWWHKEMDVLERIVDEVPCYTMRFDRSGAIVPELEKLAAGRGAGAVSDYVRRVPAARRPSPRASARSTSSSPSAATTTASTAASTCRPATPRRAPAR